LKYFENDYVRALCYVFPELGLDENKFLYITRTCQKKKKTRKTQIINFLEKYYKDASKRRKWFEKIAIRRGMDPLLPATWYKLAKLKFHAMQVASFSFPLYPSLFVLLTILN
jgi:hypothetical protein